MNNMLNRIYNQDCRETMNVLSENSVDVVLTSPPYNISRGVDTDLERERHSSKYEGFNDAMSYEEYEKFMLEVFNGIDRVLKPNGAVLLNLSYASNKDAMKCTNMFYLISSICKTFDYEVADIITWKKKSAIPNNRSKRTLTRIVEYVFVLCRKNEYTSFHTNKKEVRRNDKNYVFYENIYNFIEAKNNDGTCPYNKATYSSELCEKLLNIYAPENGVIYDPFMGTGTTAEACKRLQLNYIGSEISGKQCEWAENRIAEVC